MPALRQRPHGEITTHLRDLVAAWVRSNCPRTDLQANLLQHFDRAADRGVTCSFTVGRELTRSGKAFMIYCYAGELFAFELTAEQAVRLHVADNMLQCAEGPRQHPTESKPEPVVWIEEVTVDNAAALDPMAPITGTLRYRTTQLLREPIAIRVTCEPPGRGSTCLYYHLLRLQPPAGTVRFTLSSVGDLRDGNGVPFVGALPLFFQVVTTSGPQPQTTGGSPGQVIGVSQPQPGWPTGLLPKMPTVPGMPKPVMPRPTQFPLPYDPATQSARQVQQEQPVSDIPGSARRDHLIWRRSRSRISTWADIFGGNVGLYFPL